MFQFPTSALFLIYRSCTVLSPVRQTNERVEAIYVSYGEIHETCYLGRRIRFAVSLSGRFSVSLDGMVGRADSLL